jgi:2-(1,2-epoxy-1,2-dihydrophenyl)acetyl-CoA isomerase
VSEANILYAVTNGVGRITLNRPQTLNAWTPEFGSELLAAVSRAHDADGVRAVLITGAGRGFSTGADLGAALPLAEDGRPDLRTLIDEVYHPVISGLRELPKPVLAAVNGPAVGIGCSLALACDLILVAESAYLGLAFVGVGLMPDGGSTALVPAAVGKARASQLALLGERLDARTALEWGLINAVHPDAELLPAAERLAERLAAGPTRSYASTKRALNQFVFGGLEAQLALESELQHALARTDDVAEGAAAFLAKRAPVFTGR